VAPIIGAILGAVAYGAVSGEDVAQEKRAKASAA
jgi:hypothetical protein